MNTEENKINPEARQQQSQKDDVIDLREVFLTLWKRKKLFIWVWIITTIVAAALIFPVPRYYVTEVKLAPELDNSMSSSALGSIASSFGFDMGGMQTTDAIYPMIYPELFESNEFIVNLFDVQVKNMDGDIHTDLYTYMKDYQEKTVYMIPVIWLQRQLLSLFPKKKVEGEPGIAGKINPYNSYDGRSPA